MSSNRYFKNLRFKWDLQATEKMMTALPSIFNLCWFTPEFLGGLNRKLFHVVRDVILELANPKPRTRIKSFSEFELQTVASLYQHFEPFIDITPTKEIANSFIEDNIPESDDSIIEIELDDESLAEEIEDDDDEDSFASIDDAEPVELIGEDHQDLANQCFMFEATLKQLSWECAGGASVICKLMDIFSPLYMSLLNFRESYALAFSCYDGEDDSYNTIYSLIEQEAFLIREIAIQLLLLISKVGNKDATFKINKDVCLSFDNDAKEVVISDRTKSVLRQAKKKLTKQEYTTLIQGWIMLINTNNSFIHIESIQEFEDLLQ